MLLPATTVPLGRGTISSSVEKPPPIPPKVLPGSATDKVSFLSGIHKLVLTWTLACVCYRSPCTCSHRDFTDSHCAAVRVTVRLTVVPSAPKTSIGNSVRPEVASADWMWIVRAARNRRTSNSGHIFSVHYHDDATPTACNSELCVYPPLSKIHLQFKGF